LTIQYKKYGTLFCNNPFAALALVLGPLNEILLTYYGAWSYTLPSFFRIPIWLIPLYGIFALAVRRISIVTTTYFFKKAKE